MALNIGHLAAGTRGYVDGTQRKEALDRSYRADDQRNEAATLKLDELKKDAAYKDLTRKHQTAVGAFLQSGGSDLEPMKDYFRSTPGSQFEDLTQAEDGSYDFKVGGKIHKIPDADSLGSLSMMGLDPKTYLKGKLEADKQGRTDKREAMKRITTREGGMMYYLDEKNVARPIVDEKGKPFKGETYAGKRLGTGAGGNQSRDTQFMNWAIEKLNVNATEAMQIWFDLLHNPEKGMAQIYSKRIEGSEKNYFPTDPNKPTREQIMEETKADIEEIMGSARPPAIRRGGKGGGAAPADPMGGFMNREPRAAGTGVTSFKYGVPGGRGAPAEGGAMSKPTQLPPKAIQALKNAGGKSVKFNNGTVWKLGPDGQPVQVK